MVTNNKYDEALEAIDSDLINQARVIWDEHSDRNTIELVRQALTLAAKLEKHEDALRELVYAGDKAYLGYKVQTEFDGGNCLSASDEHTQCDLTVLAIFNHINFDRGQNKANADFFAKAANSRPILKELLEEIE